MQQTIKCPHCGDPIVLVAAVADPQAVERSGRQKGQASAEIPIREAELSPQTKRSLEEMNLDTLGELAFVYARKRHWEYIPNSTAADREVRRLLIRKGLLDLFSVGCWVNLIDNPRVCGKLDDAGIETLGDLMNRTREELAEIKGIGEHTLDVIEDALRVEFDLELPKRTRTDDRPAGEPVAPALAVAGADESPESLQKLSGSKGRLSGATRIDETKIWESFSESDREAIGAAGIETLAQLAEIRDRDYERVKKCERAAKSVVTFRLGHEGFRILCDAGLIDLDKESITELLMGLPTRVQNAIEASGMWTVGQLISVSPRRLKSIRGVGDVAVQHLRDALTRYGLSLKGESDGGDISRAAAAAAAVRTG